MPISRKHLVAGAFLAAAGVCLMAARFAVQFVEERSEIEVRSVLDVNGLTWAEVESDGLQVLLAGTAPSEALRFRALSLAGSVVDAQRLIDVMDVAPTQALAPPEFSAEVLRNTSGVSIIGLIPASSDRAAITEGFAAQSDVPVTDLLEIADYPAPEGWEDALAFAMDAIEDLPRAKVSVHAGRVAITAIADSATAKETMEKSLRRSAPPALRLTLDISSPRPVITPFALRFVKDESGARFDACSADTPETRTRILDAGSSAGLTGPGGCTIGMGVPSPNWAKAVELSISALDQIGAGTVTFSDADVTLAAAPGSDAAVFDRVIGELETALPQVFVLNAVLPLAEDEDAGPVEFVATLSPEGQVQLRGRVTGETMREATNGFAKAKFGSENVYMAARVVPDLPGDWSLRVLTALDALGYLDNGIATVTTETLLVSGRSGNPEAREAIARLFVEKLGDDQPFDIDIEYVEALDPVAALPTPEECEFQIAEVVADTKITFEPGSATIDSSALNALDRIAAILTECGDLKLEVQGHTDSQGREEMNLSLSQARAESVLNELRARRVLTSRFIAKGYGETTPIAENDSEEGREANRRIDFKLIRPPESVEDVESTLESLAKKGDTETTDE